MSEPTHVLLSFLPSEAKIVQHKQPFKGGSDNSYHKYQPSIPGHNWQSKATKDSTE